MVDFACDAYGSPILAVSSLAVHTKVCMKFEFFSSYISEELRIMVVIQIDTWMRMSKTVNCLSLGLTCTVRLVVKMEMLYLPHSGLADC